MEEFTYHTRLTGTRNEIVVLDIGGAIFLSNFITFKEVLDNLDARYIRFLIINFEEISFLSSPAIGAILEMNGKINRRGGGMAVINVSPEISSILEFLSFHKLIKISADEKSAVNYLLAPDGSEEDI
jgi:anti-anti-sigma factor